MCLYFILQCPVLLCGYPVQEHSTLACYLLHMPSKARRVFGYVYVQLDLSDCRGRTDTMQRMRYGCSRVSSQRREVQESCKQWVGSRERNRKKSRCKQCDHGIWKPDKCSTIVSPTLNRVCANMKCSKEKTGKKTQQSHRESDTLSPSCHVCPMETCHITVQGELLLIIGEFEVLQGTCKQDL